MSLFDYLTACRKNDLAAVKANYMRFINKRETRTGHFLGFSGIHYAVYFGNVDVFNLLMPYELASRTQDVIYVVDQYDQVIYEIPPHTNVFMLAILANRVEILQALETYFYQNAGVFWGKWSDRKRTKDALRNANSAITTYVAQNLLPLLETLKNGPGKNGLLADFS